MKRPPVLWNVPLQWYICKITIYVDLLLDFLFFGLFGYSFAKSYSLLFYNNSWYFWKKFFRCLSDFFMFCKQRNWFWFNFLRMFVKQRVLENKRHCHFPEQRETWLRASAGCMYLWSKKQVCYKRVRFCKLTIHLPDCNLNVMVSSWSLCVPLWELGFRELFRILRCCE